MIKFNDISVGFGKKEILKNINFSLPEEQITVLIGKNGSGKSTLVSCITNSIRFSGDIFYGEKSIKHMLPRERAKIAAVLPQVLPRTSLTVEELVSMGRTPYIAAGRSLSSLDKDFIEFAITSAAMDELRAQRTDLLSGGERQKAYLAMILAQNTPVVVLDEPTTYMDMSNEAAFLALALELKTVHKKTLMIVMHDLTKAVEIADNVLVLDNGQNVFFGSAEDCVSSGIIEKVFAVRKSSYNKGGSMKIMYYK